MVDAGGCDERIDGAGVVTGWVQLKATATRRWDYEGGGGGD